MNRPLYYLLLLCMILPARIATATVHTDTYTFASQSLLRSGKWVKVEVEESGIYEISYDELKALGFSNPAAVCVYGEGGAKRGLDMGEAGERFVEDNPPQVPVLHKNSKIYFYGRGICNVAFPEGRFTYEGRNIYNTKGHYFLSDTGTPSSIQSLEIGVAAKNSAPVRNDGMGYILHDDDRMMGMEEAGQHFWEGEFGAQPSNSFSASVSLPYAAMPGKYILESRIPVVREGGNVLFSFNVNGNTVTQKPTQQINHVWDIVTEGNINKSSADVTIKADTEDATDSYFDYWLLSYPKNIGIQGASLRQEVIAFPGSGNGGAAALLIPSSSLAFDISDPASPAMLPMDGNKAFFNNPASSHALIVFNPGVPQLKVSNPVAVPNTNLHSAVNDNISLLIIHVPETREYANTIAELHRRYDKINVLVTDVERIYDEFGGGNTDPLSIRMLARMLHKYGSESLKNILFVGPVRSDVRNILGLEQPENFLIAFQEAADISADRRPSFTFDYFGMTSDNVSAESLYESPMKVGVGWLPITDATSAGIVIAKIEDYLKNLDSDEFAWYVNEVLLFAHGGDGQIHDDQLKTWERNISDMTKNRKIGRFSVSSLHQDTYGSKFTGAISSRLNDGNLINVYTGHARPGGFGIVDTFFTLKEFDNLRNRVPTFMIMSGCETIYPDFGGTGVGIEPLIHSPRGMAGIITSGRTTYSSSNAKLVGYFFQGLMSKGSGYTPREVPATAGESFAFMKAQSYNFNELSYLYIGDPALTIPVPLRAASATITNEPEGGFSAGDVVEIEGNLMNMHEGTDTGSKGGVVAKLMAPSITLPFPNMTPTYSVEIDDIRLTAVKGKANNGAFKLKIPIPAEVSKYVNTGSGSTTAFPLYISAYNPDTRLSYSGYITIPIAKKAAQGNPGGADNEAPVVAARFDSSSRMLAIDVTDNIGFMPTMNASNGVRLTIDGTSYDGYRGELTDPAAVTGHSFRMHLGNMNPGRHTAKIMATDLCGNSSAEKTVTFEITDELPSISINCDSAYAVETMHFSIDAEGFSNLELYILDEEGTEIHSQQVSGTSGSWNRTDTHSGIKAPAGTYRVGLRTTDARPVNSTFSTFVILD